MLDGTEEIIRKLEAARDECVRRYNGAIDLLRGGSSSVIFPSQPRFQAKVAPRPPRVQPTLKKAKTQPKRRRAHVRANGQPSKSVRDVIREAVRSQTQPFTVSNVKDYVKTRYPAIAATMIEDRYSKELYDLRTKERLFEISSKGEKGGAHIFKLKAA